MMGASGGSSADFAFQGAVLSHNGSLILAPCGSALRLFSAVTGGQVGVLEGHEDNISCVAINAKSSTQVYTASCDGTFRLWDYVALECLRTIQVKETVVDMVFHPERSIVYLSVHRDSGSGRVIAYDIEKERAGRTAMKTSVARPLYCSGVNKGVGSTAHTFIATFDRHSLLVWRVGDDIYQPLNLRHTKPFTCAAISADEEVIAAGDASGRVLIWRGFGAHVPTTRQDGHTRQHAEGLHPTTLHWHASAVGCLAFSPDGSYLLSGGKEAVMVLWKLDGSGQNFLPRLGGALATIRPSGADPSKYLVCQTDNTLRVVSVSSMSVLSSVFGVKPAPAGLSPRGAAAATLLQPGSGYLLLPSENGEMQLYDTLRDRHVSLIKIINRNYVAMPERPQPPAHHPHAAQLQQHAASSSTPTQPFVSHATFAGPGGSVLVTVDVRPAPGAATGAAFDTCLRFWDAAGAATRTGLDVPFTLNTRVDDPHGPGGVAALVASGGGELVLTAGAGDAEFRLWERAAVARRPGGKAASPTSWRCRAMGGYKSLPLTAAAFSADGSALVVAAGPKVTLWDPQGCRMAAVLALPAQHSTPSGAVAAAAAAAGLSGAWGVVRRLAFAPGSPHVIAATDGCVAVWDLLTGSLAWALDLANTALAVDPLHGVFAVAAPMPPVSPRRPPTPTAAAAAGDKPQGTAPGEAAAAAAAAAAGTQASGPNPHPAAAAAAAMAPRSLGSHILVFDPRSPTPKYFCTCPGTLLPVLLFATPDMPQAANPAAAASVEGSVGSAGTSPLLLVTERRVLQYVSPPATSSAVPSKAIAATDKQQQQQQGQEVSAFEAAFGAVQVSGGRKSVGAGLDGMDVDEDPTKPRWRQLFDAPSHALPPPTALAEAFLRLINA